MKRLREIWQRLRRPLARASHFFLKVHKRRDPFAFHRARIQLILLFLAVMLLPALLIQGHFQLGVADTTAYVVVLGGLCVFPALFYLFRAGHDLISGNLFQLIISGGIWFWMFNGSATPLNRLDTITLVIAALIMAPLLTNRRGLYLHHALNVLLLILFLSRNPDANKLSPEMLRGYALDTSIAVFLIIVISHLFLRTNTSIHKEAELTNLNLRGKVRERTEKLVRAREMIHSSREEIQHDMNMASYVQRDILLPKMPAVQGWDLAHYFRPCSLVSGDFYDIYHEKDILRGVAVFDVSGHGVASGLITMLAKSIIMRRFHESASLAGVMELIDDELTAELAQVNNFLTGILVRCEDDFVEIVNAGHCDPLYQPRGGDTRSVKPAEGPHKGTVLGVSTLRSFYPVPRTDMDSGDMLLIYTDGISERENPAGEQYGEARLRRAMDAAGDRPTAQSRLAAIVENLEAFSGASPGVDDETIILLLKK